MVSSVADIEAHRAALTGHCYRMLGSAADADDAVQDTIIRAWRGLERFDGRASLRTWLYRIATNVCLDALAEKKRRTRPVDEGASGTPNDELTQRAGEHWVEPVPDALAIPPGAQPAEIAILRQSIRLAFVAALQHLPAKQRAALLLVDVLGCSAAEAAESLETTAPAINSALQRARATLAAQRQPEPVSDAQLKLAERYAEAFERYDLDLLATLLHEDVTLSMPPYELWLQGRDNIREWMQGRGVGCLGSRLTPVEASGAPAFAQYRLSPDGQHRPWSLIVLEIVGDRVASMTHFLDVEKLFPMFGLPAELKAAR